MAANALVGSLLDYCNSLFCLSSKIITKLQNIQNCLVRFVPGAPRFLIVPGATLNSLHWLPVKQQIIFKPLVLINKYLTTGNPNTLPCFSLFIHLRLKRDIVIQKRCFPNFPSIASVCKSKVHFNKCFSYDAPNSGMIYHCKFELLRYYYVSKGDLNLSVSEVFPSLGFLTTEH